MYNKTRFKISGIHCKSCKSLIEEEVGSMNGVKSINVDHLEGTADLEINEDIIKRDVIIETVKKLGYSISSAREDKNKENNKNIQIIKNISLFALFLLFVVGYYGIQYFGGFEILSKLNEKSVSYSLILLIGFLASFHCVGMCGGLVITYSANNAKRENNKSINSHFQYNFGRLVSYTIIGGILGGFGSFFGINPDFSGIILLAAGFFMILMGLSILTKFKWLEAIKIKTPEFIAKFLYRNKKSNKPKGPLVIGLLTGLMPCGPLQAMQLFALTTGSIFEGAMAMFLYAIGTIPLMFGFGSVISALSSSKIKQVIKASGYIVMLLGIFMINRGLVNFGLGFESFMAGGAQSKTEYIVTGNIEEVQVIEMDVTYSGYRPNIIYIKKDIPVKWIIKDKGITGCTNEIFLYHEDGIIKRKLNQKENIIEFTPGKLGELKFSCWMKMVWGKFIVTEDGGSQANNLYKETVDILSPDESCNGSCGNLCEKTEQSACGCSKARIKTN